MRASTSPGSRRLGRSLSSRGRSSSASRPSRRRPRPPQSPRARFGEGNGAPGRATFDAQHPRPERARGERHRGRVRSRRRRRALPRAPGERGGGAPRGRARRGRGAARAARGLVRPGLRRHRRRLPRDASRGPRRVAHRVPPRPLRPRRRRRRGRSTAAPRDSCHRQGARRAGPPGPPRGLLCRRAGHLVLLAEQRDQRGRRARSRRRVDAGSRRRADADGGPSTVRARVLQRRLLRGAHRGARSPRRRCLRRGSWGPGRAGAPASRHAPSLAAVGRRRRRARRDDPLRRGARAGTLGARQLCSRRSARAG